MTLYSIGGILLCCLLIACIEPDSSTSPLSNSMVPNPIFIDIYSPSSSEGRVSMQDLIQIEHVIPLETQDSSLLMSIDKLISHEGRLYILDKKSSALKIFDTQGRYLKSVGKIGKGPGEFIRLNDFELAKSSNQLLVYSNHSQSLIRYDLNGTYLTQTNVPFFAFFFSQLAEEQYAFYINYNSSNVNDHHNLLITDHQLNIQQTLFPYKGDLQPAISFSGNLSRNQEGLLYTDAFNDTIFQYRPEGIYPKYIIDFEGESVPESLKQNFSRLVNELTQYNYLLNGILETEEALSFSYLENEYIQTAFWHKQKQTFISSSHLSENSIFQLFNPPVGIHAGDEFITVIHPAVVHRRKEQDPNFLSELASHFPQLYTALQEVQEVQNPILVFFRLK